MRHGGIFRLRLRSIFSRKAVERELDEELRYHLERQIDEYVAAGMSRRDARLAALRSMGAVEPNKEECRDGRGLNPLDHLWRDAGFALRQLRRSPGFAATAILMLAMGICASSTIFAFVDAALLKPLPYREPARLVDAAESIAMIPRSPFSFPDYVDYKQQNPNKPLIEALPQKAGAPRVPFFIFDEWDESLTFPNWPAGFKLPELNRFRAQSFHVDHAIAEPRVDHLHPIPAHGKDVCR